MKLQSRHFILVLVATLIVEFVVISYNHYTGFLNVSGIIEFLLRLIIGTLLAFVPAMVMFAINLKAVWLLNKRMDWENHYRVRIPVELIMIVLTGILLSSIITLTAHFIAPYREGIVRNLINNGLITIAINIVIVTVIEAWYYFLNWRDSAIEQQRLQAKVAQARYELLKNQVNPHFLFNSLNVLSALVKKDPSLAERFIDEFAKIYRHVLETNDREVINLSFEIEFAHSFLFLQKIRYGEGLQFHFEIPSCSMGMLVVPLSLQLLLENAIKHNVITPEKKLEIRISVTENHLIVCNNLQLKNEQVWSSGIGLKNLTDRYSLITDDKPLFRISDQSYIAEIPLIEPET